MALGLVPARPVHVGPHYKFLELEWPLFIRVQIKYPHRVPSYERHHSISFNSSLLFWFCIDSPHWRVTSSRLDTDVHIRREKCNEPGCRFHTEHHQSKPKVINLNLARLLFCYKQPSLLSDWTTALCKEEEKRSVSCQLLESLPKRQLCGWCIAM